MGIYDVFISYRRGEGENGGTAIAESLYRYLTEKGLRVFFDVEKMKDGHYFWPQIEEGIKVAPNYVLIGTTEAFRFREVDEENEQRDYVKDEITLALSEYEKSAEERTVTVLVAPDANIPEIKYMPPAQRRITLAQRIIPEYGKAVSAVFPKVFDAVTQISRRNLWNAAQRWYAHSRSGGGRFSSLSIDETIMPFTSDKRPHTELPIRVSFEERNNAPKPLLEALNSTEGHLYLIGQDGIGKTTALMYIMKQAYDKKAYAENAQIPIFVELSYAPDSASGQIYANGKSTFIRRAIFRQVRAERSFRIFGDSEIETLTDLFELPYDLAVRPIIDLLRHKSPAPEYLLLLDGLNEVSTRTIDATLDDGGKTKATVYEMIRGEILWLIENCPNVRIVLTSRADESSIGENITKLYLSEINETAVLEYLRNTKNEGGEIEETEIDRITRDTDLMNVLRVPLFLTMYASLHHRNEVTAAGEILRVFFNERRRGLPDHTLKDHLTRIEKTVNSDSAGLLEGRITTDMYDFILDFILPEIAWQLERKGEFLFSPWESSEMITQILKDRDAFAVCGEFGKAAFTSFRSSDPKKHTRATAQKLLALSDDESERNETILDICVNVLGILHYTGIEFGFVHQHIRDYFAAVKNVNTMRLSVYMFEKGKKDLALECMNRVFRDESISISVCRFMGEYLGEHKNKPYFADGKWNYGVPIMKVDRSIIDRTLGLYRNYSNEAYGVGVLSIIEILKNCRDDLRGIDFSSFDLINSCLNGHKLGENGLKATFVNSKVSRNTFFPLGHSDVITALCFSVDERFVATAGKDNKVIIWDVATGNIVWVLEKHRKQVNYVEFNKPNDRLITASDDGKIFLWDTKTFKCIELQGHKGPVKCATFSKDGKFIATVSPFDSVKIWDGYTGQFLKTLDKDPGKIEHLSFSADGQRLLPRYEATVSINAVKYWDIQSFEPIYPFTNSTIKVRAASFCPTDYCCCYSDFSGNIIVYDITSQKIINIYECYDRTVLSLDYSDDGSLILSNSYSNTSKIIDARNGDCIFNYDKKDADFISFVVSPNRNMIAAINGNVAELWDLKMGNMIRRFACFANTISSITISPDDSMFVCASDTETATVWDMKSFKYLFSVKTKWDIIREAIFTQDSNYIITTKDYDQAVFWNIKGLYVNQIDSYLRRYYRNYTRDDTGNVCIITYDKSEIQIWQRGKIIQSIPNIPGLMVSDIDLSLINEASEISIMERSQLAQYGAIF